MKDILDKIIKSSIWNIPVFDGKILLKGRKLSPSEAEQAGVIQFMVASQLLKDSRDLKRIEKLREISEQESPEDSIDDILEATRALGIKPEMLAQINEHHDKIVSQVVREASSDEGRTWERLQIVMSIEHQDAKSNRLWIGTFSKEDREKILEQALSGYKEGRTKFNGIFR